MGPAGCVVVKGRLAHRISAYPPAQTSMKTAFLILDVARSDGAGQRLGVDKVGNEKARDGPGLAQRSALFS